MSFICVPIMVRDFAPALADATAARDQGANIVEFRVDECFSGSPDEESMIRKLVEASPLPCIVTCRSASEGGHYDGDEMSRVSMYEGLVLGADVKRPPRYIDMEQAAYSASANIKQKVNLAVIHPGQSGARETSLILSIHDFAGRPTDLTRRVLRAADEPAAAVIKVAYRARSLRDSLELLDLPMQLRRPVIALGMGEFGLITRLLAPKFGGLLTFATLRAEDATAPGQPTLSDLLHLYRFREIRPSTRVYGIVGWPVSHSLSPKYHNEAFARDGVDAVYVPLPIAAGDDPSDTYLSFKATMLELIDHPGLTFRGCSITLPHKEHALTLAREQGWTIEPFAELMGAANTIAISDMHEQPSRVTVANTDAPAIAACVSRVLGSLEGRRVVVVGAGGVARAAVAACAGAKAAVTIVNRTSERASALAKELSARLPGTQISAMSIDEQTHHTWDALINCTSVGMKSGPAPDSMAAPLDAMKALSPNLVVMDTVYTPRETPLLREAARLGMVAIDGMEMFLKQAEGQQKLWASTLKRAERP
jgi:3-dehydroquinate dehydratase/shikimate dehydrogenase